MSMTSIFWSTICIFFWLMTDTFCVDDFNFLFDNVNFLVDNMHFLVDDLRFLSITRIDRCKYYGRFITSNIRNIFTSLNRILNLVRNIFKRVLFSHLWAKALRSFTLLSIRIRYGYWALFLASFLPSNW